MQFGIALHWLKRKCTKKITFFYLTIKKEAHACVWMREINKSPTEL